jgi:hypothetical protein
MFDSAQSRKVNQLELVSLDQKIKMAWQQP